MKVELTKLINNLKQLHKALSSAEIIVGKAREDENYNSLEHIYKYKQICCEQLELAHTAENYLKMGDEDQVLKIVGHIESLADKVKIDAKSLLANPNYRSSIR